MSHIAIQIEEIQPGDVMPHPESGKDVIVKKVQRRFGTSVMVYFGSLHRGEGSAWSYKYGRTINVVRVD